MASPQQQGNAKIGFKTVVLLKDQTLGIGSYGAVCKAKCDELLCAAKIIHPTLFDPTALHQIAPHREHRLPIRRFQLECEFLSTVRHPNIVQYLGVHQDPDTHLPVLLMELMDDSLTHFLESSPQPIPYHIQINISHDITLALSFLHSNGIVHRDLSSNNVLMRGNGLAKVTDFGMARIGDINPQPTRFTNTMCPGTDVYMPPEAVQDKPVYTEKIDCFSFGVITVQTFTQEFPNPGDRQITINDPRYPRPIKMSVPEIERRQNHIERVDPNHPLLPIALDCLKDTDTERPSARQLCQRVAALKETVKYRKRVKDSNGKGGEHEQIQRLQQNLEEKNRIIGRNKSMLAQKEQQLRQSREENQQQGQHIQQLQREKQLMEREKNQEIQEKERELRRVNQQLEESKRLIADFGKQKELKVMRSQVHEKDGGAKAGAVDRAKIKLRWRKGKRAPRAMFRYHNAVVHNHTVYCKYDRTDSIYSYHIPSSYWPPIPSGCPSWGGFGLAVIDGVLTTIGGMENVYDGNVTNKLFSLTGEGSGRRWTEIYPPMQWGRTFMGALCAGTTLIVAGGNGKQTVEVLNTETRQWHTAPDLPEPLSESSLALCGDVVYLLGAYRKESVYSCSLNSLLSPKLQGERPTNTRTQSSMWNRVAQLPVTGSTAVSLHGRLVAIGGKDSGGDPSTAVHMYQPTTNSWELISHMTTPRSRCLAAVLPDNQLMVVGGHTTGGKLCDSVEIGTVI